MFYKGELMASTLNARVLPNRNRVVLVSKGPNNRYFTRFNLQKTQEYAKSGGDFFPVSLKRKISRTGCAAPREKKIKIVSCQNNSLAAFSLENACSIPANSSFLCGRIEEASTSRTPKDSP